MRPPSIVLGISIGTRSMGTAVCRGNILMDHRVHTFKGQWTKAKLKVIVEKIIWMIARHQVAVIAFKSPSEPRSSPNITQLAKEIKTLAAKRNMAIKHYTLSGLKELHGGNKTKSHLAERMMHKHPQLRMKYHKEQTNRNSYYLKMFEAIACAESV